MAGLDVKVNVTGGRETVRSLNSLGDSAHEQAPTMRTLAKSAARRVSGVPVDTGELARSIDVLLVGAHGFVVGSKGVPYAHYVFKGTRYMAARPPHVPAIGRDAAAAISSNVIRSAR